jgi:hypothetical protein
MASVAALQKLTRGRAADQQDGVETLVTDDTDIASHADEPEAPRGRGGRVVAIAQRDSAA